MGLTDLLTWFIIMVTLLRINRTTEAQRHGESRKTGKPENRKMSKNKDIAEKAMLFSCPSSFFSVPQCLSGCSSAFRKCYHILPENEPSRERDYQTSFAMSIRYNVCQLRISEVAHVMEVV